MNHKKELPRSLWVYKARVPKDKGNYRVGSLGYIGLLGFRVSELLGFRVLGFRV